MRIHITAFALIMTLCAANSLAHRAGSALDTPDSCSEVVYGNPEDTRDPLNPSNKGRNPRVVDAAGNAISFPLKAGGAQLYYGNGQPMRTPQGARGPGHRLGVPELRDEAGEGWADVLHGLANQSRRSH